MKQILIIDCGAGNLHSVRKALAHVAPDDEVRITSDAAELATATHIVLPGVGAFADCMNGLKALPNMIAALEKHVRHGTTPFLGICVGMQMLFERGHEFGVHEGLGWFKGEVKPLTPADQNLRIPHMGWNKLRLKANHPLFSNIPQASHAYFVHSYHAVGAAPNDVLATVDYGGDVVAIIGRDHIVATQFHPEKSQRIGLELLTNFVRM
ncbi:MAG: imidazole glycerol phosphate synthase subunit HisH [Alphaproteobacteria bacterium]|nr:imidazole glycerol phosphate synthase subunit HisH [Alphaproteobacteria bacterium]